MQYEKVQADRVGDAGGLYGNGHDGLPGTGGTLGNPGREPCGNRNYGGVQYLYLWQRAVTSYYANGNPVTVEEYEGSTYVHLDSHPAYDNTWVKVEGKGKDKYTAIVGGGIEGNLPSTQITMKSGAVTYLIGSSSGEKAAGKTYDVEDARITVEGGSVDIIYANRSISSGNGTFSKASEQHIGTGTVTVKNNAVVGNVFGCFGYTSIDDLTINIEGNATVRESVMPGATNGTLAKER